MMMIRRNSDIDRRYINQEKRVIIFTVCLAMCGGCSTLIKLRYKGFPKIPNIKWGICLVAFANVEMDTKK